MAHIPLLFDPKDSINIRTVTYVVKIDTDAVLQFARFVDALNYGDHVPHIVSLESAYSRADWPLALGYVLIKVRGLNANHAELALRYQFSIDPI